MTNNIQFSSVCGIDIAKSVMQVYSPNSREIARDYF